MSTTPAWQTISGLTPEAEPALTPEARDAAIRKLVAEVERLAKLEFARITPLGERTLYWDPLARICNLLGISRTKLSSYSRELTGMRAHEITDRIKASSSLPDEFRAILLSQFESLKKSATPNIDASRLGDREYRNSIEQRLRARIKSCRTGNQAASLAARLGYANYSRLNRACLLAWGENIDSMEEQLLNPIVQKFLNDLRAQHTSAEPVSAPTPSTLEYAMPEIHFGPLTEDEQEMQDICDAHERRKQKSRAA